MASPFVPVKAFLAAGALAATPAHALAQILDPDPHASPAQTDVERMIHASLLGAPGADGAIAGWLAAHPEAPRADRIALYHRLCNAYVVHTWHTLAAQACGEKARMANEGGASAQMATAFAGIPPVRALGKTIVELQDNPLGSKSADVTANGVTLPWFFDSGAEISVLPQSSADRLSVRYMDRALEVSTSTNPVEGRLAVIDLLRIGDAAVENVPVLVLPDAQLTAGSFEIPGILGLQVFVAFRRMAWLDGGARLALGEDAPQIAASGHRIYWHEDGVGVPLGFGELVRGAHLDTGANTSYLWSAGRELLTPEQQASLITRTVNIGGAGGVVERQSEELAVWRSAIAEAAVTLTCVTVEDRVSSSVGRIGSDILPQLRHLVLDFETMAIDAEPMPSPPDTSPPSSCD